MKKIVILSAAVMLTLCCANAQSERKMLGQAERLIAKGQYKSAYRLLDDYDPTNDRSAVLLKKEEVVLHYFAQSIMHQLFCLVDLQAGESLDSARANFTQGEMFDFSADSLLRRLIAREPKNCNLLRGFADYFQALLDDYDVNVWEMFIHEEDLALLRKAAIKCGSASAANQLGLYYAEDNADSAIFYYRMAIRRDPTNYNAAYNLGVNEYIAEQYPEAVRHLRSAMQGYTVPSMKADAARTVGLIYDENLGRADSALYYYQAALDLDPDGVWNYLYLLRYYLKTSDAHEPALRERFYSFALRDDNTFNNLSSMVNVYCTDGHAADVAQWFEQKAADGESDFELGICHVFSGQAYAYAGQNSEAVAHFQSAIPYLQAIEAPESFIESLKQAIQELQP